MPPTSPSPSTTTTTTPSPSSPFGHQSNHTGVNVNESSFSSPPPSLNPHKWYHSFSSGMAAAITTTISTQPFDTVKTRLQIQGMKGQKFSGTFDAFRKIYREEGIRAFFKGFPPSITSMGTSMSTFFPIYNYMRGYYSEKSGLSVMNPFVITASVFTGWLSISSIISPLSLAKVRLQTAKSSGGFISTIYKVIQVEGFKGLYAGYKSSLLYSLLYAIYFSIYEPSKRFLIHEKGYDIKMITPILSAACMAISCTICYPNDVIMSRMQYQGIEKQYTGIKDAFTKTIQRDGLKGLYAGYLMNAFRLIFGSIVTFTTYENVLLFLQQS